MYTVVLPMTNNVQGKSLRISMSSTLSNVWDILVVTNVHCITLSYILLPGNCHYIKLCTLYTATSQQCTILTFLWIHLSFKTVPTFGKKCWRTILCTLQSFTSCTASDSAHGVYNGQCLHTLTRMYTIIDCISNDVLWMYPTFNKGRINISVARLIIKVIRSIIAFLSHSKP